MSKEYRLLLKKLGFSDNDILIILINYGSKHNNPL